MIMDDIILPKELAECELSLVDIGAIFVLYSLKNMDIDSQSYWSGNETMVETGQSLVDRDIIKFSKNDDDENIMEIDISKVKSLKKDFWEVIYDDDNGNDILSHRLYYGNKNSRFQYELHPMLYDNRIVWDLKHSEYGSMEDYFPVESLEEGEKFVREEIRKELEKIEQEDLDKLDGET